MSALEPIRSEAIIQSNRELKIILSLKHYAICGDSYARNSVIEVSYLTVKVQESMMTEQSLTKRHCFGNG